MCLREICVFIPDACQGPSPRSWSDRVRSGVNREETWSSEPSGLKLDYRHLSSATLSLFSCQIRSGDQTCLDMVWVKNWLSFPKTIWISRGKSQPQSSKQRGITGQPDWAGVHAAK